MFQSRNRGSFGFKYASVIASDTGEAQFQSRNQGSFDFKWQRQERQRWADTMFQSRNRGSFGFKKITRYWLSDAEQAERFQSRNRGSFGFKFSPLFNDNEFILFQSRNRGSFGFKGTPSEVLRYVLSVVAIPRATHFERRGDHRKIRQIGSKHGS